MSLSFHKVYPQEAVHHVDRLDDHRDDHHAYHHAYHRDGRYDDRRVAADVGHEEAEHHNLVEHHSLVQEHHILDVEGGLVVVHTRDVVDSQEVVLHSLAGVVHNHEDHGLVEGHTAQVEVLHNQVEVHILEEGHHSLDSRVVEHHLAVVVHNLVVDHIRVVALHKVEVLHMVEVRHVAVVHQVDLVAHHVAVHHEVEALSQDLVVVGCDVVVDVRGVGVDVRRLEVDAMVRCHKQEVEHHALHQDVVVARYNQHEAIRVDYGCDYGRAGDRTFPLVEVDLHAAVQVAVVPDLAVPPGRVGSHKMQSRDPDIAP